LGSEKHGLVFLVAQDKCPQEVNLIPNPIDLHPVFGVFERPRNITKIDVNATLFTASILCLAVALFESAAARSG
jgi:hypothetical protein